MSNRPCNSFAAAIYDPARCRVCSSRFVDHIKSVRDAWWRSAPDPLIDVLKLRLKFLEQTSPERCQRWNPICIGEDIKVCECGRIRTEHNIKVIVQGESIRRAKIPPAKVPLSASKIHPSYGLYIATKDQCLAYRKLDTGTSAYCRKLSGHAAKGDPIHEHIGPRIQVTWMNSTSVELGDPFTVRQTSANPCDNFSPVVELPGYCKFCGHRYIDHSDVAQGFQLEDITNIHSPGCVSVTKIGLNRCSCMDDSVKQMMLDSLGDVRRRTAVALIPAECLIYNPINPQHIDSCKCGKRFHQHSLTAKDGFETWTKWRAAHMTDAEIVSWFISLGFDNISRMREFKQHLDKPRELDPTAPSPEVIRRISQMLPADFHALVKIGVTEKRTNCISCGSVLLKGEQAMCEDCQAIAVGPDWIPRLKPRPPAQLATEYNINNGVNFD